MTLELKTEAIRKKKLPVSGRPSKYKVIMLNDDYTPMDFVIEVLQKYFDKRFEEAREIMLKVHHKGAAICGVYTLEIAETKVMEVKQKAKDHDYPLQCILEREDHTNGGLSSC